MKTVKNAAIGLLTVAATVIITNFLTGGSLAGLTKLKELSQTLLKSGVPAWAFALVLLIAILGIVYAGTHWPKRKGKIHLVPDAHNVGWSARGDEVMDVSLAGRFTYDGPDRLTVLQIFLKGTRPMTNLQVGVEIQNGEYTAPTVYEIWLDPEKPVKLFTVLTLKPVVGKRGKPLKWKVVFRDKYNRDFLIGPITLPYVGQR